MIEFMTLIFGGLGLAVYGAIVFYAGTRKLWWLALLVTFPAAMGGLLYLVTPVEVPSQAFLFRNFGWAVLGQLAFGALVYWAGRWKARGESSRKDPIA